MTDEEVPNHRDEELPDLSDIVQAGASGNNGVRELRFPDRMTAKDVMFIAVSIPEDMPIPDFLDLLKASDTSHFIVTTKDGKVAGLITESDILKIFARPRLPSGIGGLVYREALYRSSQIVKDIMKTHPLFVYEHQSLGEVASIMRKYNAHHVVVVSQDRSPQGLIGTKTLVAVLRILLR